MKPGFFIYMDYPLPEVKARELFEAFQEYFNEDKGDAKIASLICVKLFQDHSENYVTKSYWNSVRLHLSSL